MSRDVKMSECLIGMVYPLVVYLVLRRALCDTLCIAQGE